MVNSIRNIKIGCWVFIFIYWLLATIFQGVSAPLQNFDFSYQRPIGTPGTLQSQRGSFYAFVIAFYVTIWIVPITLAFALEDTKGRPTVASDGIGKGSGIVFWRMILQLVLVALLLLLYMGIFIYGITLWSGANGTGPGNYWNPANDPRWCCVWYNLVDHTTDGAFPCVNTAPCSPGISADMLVPNPVFLFTLWFGFVFIVAMLVDLLLVLCMVRPTYEAHALGIEKRSTMGQLKQQQQQQQYVERLIN